MALARTLQATWARGSALTARRCVIAPPTPRSLRVMAQQQQQQQQQQQHEQATKEQNGSPQGQGETAVTTQDRSRTGVQRQQQGRGGLARRQDVTPYRMNDLISQMQREMDSMLSLFDSPFLSSDFGRPFALMDRLPLPAVPAPAANLNIDVSEDEKNYYVHAEVPGFTKEQIKVTVSDDHVLTVSGDMKEEEGGDGKGKTRRMRMASFVRRLQLPEDANEEHIKATTEHGVLTVQVPKSEKAQPRIKEIPVA